MNTLKLILLIYFISDCQERTESGWFEAMTTPQCPPHTRRARTGISPVELPVAASM